MSLPRPTILRPLVMANCACYECGQPFAVVGRGAWSPYFCRDCDAERVARIGCQLADMKAHFSDEARP